MRRVTPHLARHHVRSRTIKSGVTELLVELGGVGAGAGQHRSRKRAVQGGSRVGAVEHLGVGVQGPSGGGGDGVVVGVGGALEVPDQERDVILDVDGEAVDVFLEVVDARPRDGHIIIPIVSLVDDIFSIAVGVVDGLLQV